MIDNMEEANLLDSIDLRDKIEQLQQCREVLEAARILRDIGKQLKVPYASCVDDYSEARLPLIEDGRALAEVFGWDISFINDWEANHLHLISPMGAACRITTKPFSWLAENVEEMNPKGADHRQKNWHLTTERGIYGGVMVPVHMPMSRIGSIGWVARLDEDPVDLDAILEQHGYDLRTAALLFMDILYETRPDRTPIGATANLTEREAECLSWVALGKTDAEIAIIIDRSVPTIRFHLDNAMKKLNASNRTQAAALASQLGILGSMTR
jgi:LuxR family quorum-sensing system transcriptional regulator CciR